MSSVGELLARLGLDPESLPPGLAAATGFPLRVPLELVARMRPGDPNDPILRQVLPLPSELDEVPGFVPQPLAEDRFAPVPGLLHKYRGRVLLTVTGACGVHCRYCFRRHFPYAQHHGWAEGWQRAVGYIAAESSLREVILSGGDPLAVGDDKLAPLVDELDAIAHLRTLRIHTRMPIALPARVDAGLVAWLGRTRLRRVVVLHANHAQEIDDAVVVAVGRLRAAGCSVYNQSVLLAGVNDEAAALIDLSLALDEAHVTPYYLHLLDPVQGAAHFEVDAARARRLLQEVRAELPGYLVPRLVREVPGAPAKTPVGA